jgi:hypothetical protein
MPEIGQAWIDGLLKRKDGIQLQKHRLDNTIMGGSSWHWVMGNYVADVSALIGYISSIEDLRSKDANDK